MLRVGVVGGSLGGLTAALVLRDAGCSVDVYERTSGPMHDYGAGIILHGVSARYFLGRSPIALDDISIPSRVLRYLSEDGSVGYEEPSRYRFTAWNALYRGLLSCFGEERYHRGEALVGLDQTSEQVQLRFAGGRVEACDLAVGADGAFSTVRQRLAGVTPRYSGYVGWRGMVSERDLSPETWATLDAAFTYGLMTDGHIVAYPIPTLGTSIRVTGRLVNFTWYRNVDAGRQLDELMTDRTGFRRPVSVHSDGVQKRCVNDMREAAGRCLAPPLAELVEAAKKPFITAIVDAGVSRFAFGRVCLIGDAAITARPHAAAGAAKAVADAWALGDAIRSTDGDIAQALLRWEPRRLEIGRTLLARTRDLGKRLQFGGPWTPGDPGLKFGLEVPGDLDLEPWTSSKGQQSPLDRSRSVALGNSNDCFHPTATLGVG